MGRREGWRRYTQGNKGTKREGNEAKRGLKDMGETGSEREREIGQYIGGMMGRKEGNEKDGNVKREWWALGKRVART